MAEHGHRTDNAAAAVRADLSQSFAGKESGDLLSVGSPHQHDDRSAAYIATSPGAEPGLNFLLRGAMSAIEKPVITSSVAAPAPISAAQQDHAPAPPTTPRWQKYGTPALVVLLAAAVVTTIMWNWNAWEGGRIDQVTDDAYVRGDLTPLSTKVAGIVKDVTVSDFQQVHKGDL